MIFVLDLRAVGDHEADFAKTAYDVLCDLGEGMEFAQGAAAAGQREIGRFGGERGLKFQFGAAFRERGFEFGLRHIDELAGGGFFLLGQRTELFHERGEFALGAEVSALGLFERGQFRRGLQLGERRLFQRFDLVKK